MDSSSPPDSHGTGSPWRSTRNTTPATPAATSSSPSPSNLRLRLRTNPKPSSLKRAINDDTEPVEKGSQGRKGPDRHSSVARTTALTNVDPTMYQVRGDMEFEGKLRFGVHWYNLATPFKLILIAELVSDRTSMNKAMNTLRMDIDERKDYFETYDDEEARNFGSPKSHHVKEDVYQFARRFLMHRLSASPNSLSSLLEKLRKYRGKMVAHPICVEDYPPVAQEETDDRENDNEDAKSEETLQGMDGEEMFFNPPHPPSQNGIADWPVVDRKEVLKVRMEMLEAQKDKRRSKEGNYGFVDYATDDANYETVDIEDWLNFGEGEVEGWL